MGNRHPTAEKELAETVGGPGLDARKTAGAAPWSEQTRSYYVRHVRAFTAFIGRSPDTATTEDLRLFQLHQTQIGVQPPSINSAVAALCFFFTVMLERLDLAQRLTVVPQPRRDTGGASSVEEVTLLLRAASAPKYKAAFATAYRPGLRVSEGVALKVCDVVAASSGKGPLTTRPSKVAPISAMRQIPAICHAPPICRRGASAR